MSCSARSGVRPRTPRRGDCAVSARVSADCRRFPVTFTGAPAETEFVIDRLFPGNPLICCAKEERASVTRSREEWRDTKLSTLQYIVPGPMSGRTGTNQKHEVSSHCLDNVGPRRFAVIEQDRGNANEQAAVLLDLANVFALALVVYSGKSSLHGWFCVEGESENLISKFYDRAVRHGADNATRCRCQLVRMPGGDRQNGAPADHLFRPGGDCVAPGWSAFC
jgi:hypothetical protein